MRTEDANPKLRVASLKELDALIGKYLVKETPQVFWEEEHACMRFDSIEEALDAMRDPYFQLFIPEDARANTALKEVQEFRAYSSELALAWEVVERVSPQLEPLPRALRKWPGLRFGTRPSVVACSRSAPSGLAGSRDGCGLCPRMGSLEPSRGRVRRFAVA